jgi:hypothetical protein
MGESAVKDKLIIILISLFLITCCLPTLGLAVNLNRLKQIDNTTFEYLYNNNDFFPLVIKGSTVEKDIKDIDIALKPKIKITPDYFSWMDYQDEDWTTPVKSQGWCGSCWAFAALGIIESAIEIKEGSSNLNPDLSEQYLLSYLPKAGSCSGGTCTNALELIINTTYAGNFQNGVIQESYLPYLTYEEDESIDLVEKYPNWKDLLVPILNFGTWRTNPEDREEIKTQIMESGPVAAAMYVIPEFTKWLMTHHKPDEYFSYPGVVQGTNHEVIIVGWKDSSNIKNGGYWICKNSWGKGFGYDGYFNLEYGSLNLDNSKIAFVEYDPESFDWSPVTQVNGIYQSSVGEEITFDSSGSFDADGEIVQYYWDFGDGTSSFEPVTTHVYYEKGIYKVSLSTFDNNGNVGVEKTWAFIDQINEKPKRPTISGPKKGMDRTWYDYTFSATDPEGDDLYYYIDWGDGFIDEWLGPFSSGEDITINHLFYFKDIYKIRVKVKDIYGTVSDWESFRVGVPEYRSNHDSSLFRYLVNFFDPDSLLAQLLEKILRF